MPNESFVEPVSTRPSAFFFRRVSWGAIFAGLFVTLIMQVLFTVLGLAVSTTLNTPWATGDLSGGLALGAEIWLLGTGLVSLFIGAGIAGRLSGGPRLVDGMLHGVVTWSVSMLATIFFLASLTGAGIGGLGSLVGLALTHPGTPRVAISENQAHPNISRPLAPTGRSGSDSDMAPENEQSLGDGNAAGISNGLSNAWWGFVALSAGLLVAAWAGWIGASSLPEPVVVTSAPEPTV